MSAPAPAPARPETPAPAGANGNSSPWAPTAGAAGVSYTSGNGFAPGPVDQIGADRSERSEYDRPDVALDGRPQDYRRPDQASVSPSPSPEVAGAGRAVPEAEAGAPRVARLTVASIDPWSALKLSFLLSVAAAIALVIAVAVLWVVLNAIGVFDQLNHLLGTLGLDSSTKKFDIYDYVGFGKVLSITIVIGIFNAFLLTALSTIGVLLYNLSSGLVGGVRVTLSDD